MKEIFLTEDQVELIRCIFLAEQILSLDNEVDEVGERVFDELGQYAPFRLYKFKSEEVEYIRLRLYALSEERKAVISKCARLSGLYIPKINKTISELKTIFS